MGIARCYFAVAFCTIAVALAACGGSLISGPVANMTLQHGQRNGATQASWMAPDAAQIKELFYSSDPVAGVVHVYDYQTGRPVGRLAPFWNPQGQCVAANGNVFVANQGYAQVNEYAHGRIRPIKIFNAGGSPVGCAVAPNGDLAIGNLHTPTGQGDIVIFKGAKGQGKAYVTKSCYYIEGLGYDGNGNLYVTASPYHARQIICELPHGGTRMRVVKSNVKSKDAPQLIMWDGKHMTLAYLGHFTPAHTTIFQMQENANGDLRKIGAVKLSSGGCYYGGWTFPFLVGKKNTPDNHQLATAVAGESYRCTKVFTWRYPTGGSPYRGFHGQTEDGPSGLAVSIAE